MADMGIIGYFRTADLLTVVIRGIGYGLVIAAFIAFFINIKNKKIVKRLLDAKALSRDSAKSAAEIGAGSGFGRFALRDKSMLRKTVEATEAADADGKDLKRYYIPEEKAAGAEIRYVKRNSPVGWVVGMALLAAATEGAVLALPWILSLFN